MSSPSTFPCVFIEEAIMLGTIRGKDVLLHPITIISCWGPRCYLRCLRAVVSGKPCTFLGIVAG